jgi:Cys-tRNA(Pro) deacylase
LGKEKEPVTPAVRMLREKGVGYTPRFYAYEDKGGTGVAARELGVDEHAVIKTLVMAAEGQGPLVVLMHGDCQVSTRGLARHLGARAVAPVDPLEVTRLTGYQVGGVSPFGTKRELPVYVEQDILSLPRIFINGGKRGFLLEMDPGDLARALKPIPVRVAVEQAG